MKKWIKLYTEILDDPKMGRLTDRQFRTCINLFLLAGIVDCDGLLPTLADIAWKLRMPEKALAEDLGVLAKAGIVEETAQGWLVTHFAARQAPPPSAMPSAVRQRVRHHRQRHADAGEQHAPETPLPSACNDSVTTLSAHGNAAVTPVERDGTRLDTDTDSDPDPDTETDPERTQTDDDDAEAIAAREAFHKLRRRQVYDMLHRVMCRRFGWWSAATAWDVAGEAADAGHNRDTARRVMAEFLGSVRRGVRMTSPGGLLRAKLRIPPGSAPDPEAEALIASVRGQFSPARPAPARAGTGWPSRRQAAAWQRVRQCAVWLRRSLGHTAQLALTLPGACAIIPLGPARRRAPHPFRRHQHGFPAHHGAGALPQDGS